MPEAPPSANLFAPLARTSTDEDITVLLTTPNVRIERIVSTGQASPPGFWYDQNEAEWVVLLTGGAGLRFDGETQVRALKPGDYLHIPAHARHRVERADGLAGGPHPLMDGSSQTRTLSDRIESPHFQRSSPLNGDLVRQIKFGTTRAGFPLAMYSLIMTSPGHSTTTGAPIFTRL